MPSWIINLAGDIWVSVFATSFVLSLIAGATQQFRGKPLLETPVLPLLAVLHIAWVLPFIAPIILIWLVFAGLRAIWRQIFGKIPQI